MKISLVKEGLFNPGELAAWRKESYERIHRGVEAGMKEAGAAIVPKLRANMEQALKLKKKAFSKVMTVKVHARIKDRLPVMDLGASRPGWLGMHETGGTIKGPLLIPLLETRMGYVAFKKVVDTIMRNGAGWFKRLDDGRLLLMAEYQPAYGQPLAKFRRAERARKGGTVKKGEDIPIAILLPQVTLKKRLRVREIVQQNLPMIAAAIEKNING
jgi:hypothetical protein